MELPKLNAKELIFISLKCKDGALTGMAQWVGCHPANQKFISSIPESEHMPGLQARSPVGGMRKATNRHFSRVSR